MSELLTRDVFRESVFERDNYLCVNCGKIAQDAHHIMERRLFDNGGYFIDNGASVCGECHLLAESTLLTCEELREKAGIKEVVLPEHFYHDLRYDKWGNVLIGKRRMKGELFYDESVQKVIKPVLHEFTDYVKYPRTYHLPWSESVLDDDKTLKNVSQFIGKEVVVLEKLDGENYTFYQDYSHARSIESGYHVSRTWVKNLWSKICMDIPKGWRICGENMYAKHSIYYENLKSYFYVFSVWDDKNICLSWDDTILYAKLLNLEIAPVLYRGIYDEKAIRGLSKQQDLEKMEGYVVRLTSAFPYGVFRTSVGKFVRRDHVRTHAHWISQQITKNKLAIL